jgi:cytochrome P450
MADRVGRKPRQLEHVEQLYGSRLAKDWMRVFLETLRGELPIADACRLLGLSESYFHESRRRWLQQSLEQLEPRRLGRPPKQPDARQAQERCAQLEAEVARLREQLAGAETRQEIAGILGDPAGEPGEKTDRPAPPTRKPR